MNSMESVKLIAHEELAKQILEEKYNDSFEIKEVLGDYLWDGYYTVSAYQTDQPELLFLAAVEAGGQKAADNYVCKRVAQELSHQAERNLDELPGFYYIFSTPLVDNMHLQNPQMTVSQYMQECPHARFHIYLNYCPDNEEMVVDTDRFYHALEHILDGLECISGRINLYLADESAIQFMQAYRENHDQCYYDYHEMADRYYTGCIAFENGKIKATRNDIKQMMESKENGV